MPEYWWSPQDKTWHQGTPTADQIRVGNLKRRVVKKTYGNAHGANVGDVVWGAPNRGPTIGEFAGNFLKGAALPITAGVAGLAAPLLGSGAAGDAAAAAAHGGAAATEAGTAAAGAGAGVGLGTVGTVAKLGLGAAALLGTRGKATSADTRRAIAELRASQPVGYITPEDQRAAEQTRGRLVESVNAGGQQAQQLARRRAIARGLSSAGDEARIEEAMSLGRENAANTAEEQLANMRTGREQYGQQKDLAIFGAQVGQAQRDQQRQDAEHAAFWNTLPDLIGPIIDHLGTGTPSSASPGTTTAVRGYVPGAPSIGGGTRYGRPV